MAAKVAAKPAAKSTAGARATASLKHKANGAHAPKR
jgi:hypothetical protein